MDNQSSDNKHRIESKEQIRQQYVDGTLALHREWLNNPITKFLAQNFDKHRELHLIKLNGMLGDKEISADFFRAQAMNIKNTDALVRLTFDSETFVNMLVRNIQQEQQEQKESK